MDENAQAAEDVASGFLDLLNQEDGTTPAPDKEQREEAKPEVEETEGEDAAPEEEASGDDDEGTDEPETAIEPPASWTKDAKAKFAALPSDVQQYVAERERERDLAINRGQNEVAEAKRASESAKQAAEQERQQLSQLLQQAQTFLQAEFMRDFQDVTDPQKLADMDPARFTQYQARLMKIQNINSEQARVQQQQQAEQQANYRNWVIEQEKTLLNDITEWKADLSKGKAEISEIKSYLRSEGLKDEEVANLVDARFIKLARKANLYDKLMKAKPQVEKKLVDLPKVQKPGVSKGKGSLEAERHAAKVQRLKKTGNVNDYAALLQDRL